jgi:acetyl-CoA C-acetyltransferase
MANGIRDKVALIGMGCTKFGERWDVGPAELMAEAFEEALLDAGIERQQIDAAWFGSCTDTISVGNSAIPAAMALRLDGIAVSHMENMCATGTEVLRAAAYAVASGAVDFALAIGAEKLKDTGYGGLPAVYKGTFNDLWMPNGSAAGGFAQLAAGYRTRHGISKQDLKQAMAHVSWKSHQNGTLSPKAHLRKAVTMEQILNAPTIAEPLGLFDCCGVSDGAAAAIVTTPDIARSLARQNGHRDLVTIKAIQLSIASGVETGTTGWDGSHVRTTRKAAQRAYAEAGITKPREQLSLMEVHDCFSITELVTMEDLFISEDGHAPKDILNGFFDREGGGLPCQVDGGLKCFGHPIAASGLRMAYEVYNQLLQRAGPRQLAAPSLGLTHNLGGVPYLGIAGVSILGLHS